MCRCIPSRNNAPLRNDLKAKNGSVKWHCVKKQVPYFPYYIYIYICVVKKGIVLQMAKLISYILGTKLSDSFSSSFFSCRYLNVLYHCILTGILIGISLYTVGLLGTVWARTLTWSEDIQVQHLNTAQNICKC